ncbi:MAG TPA: FAD binding domain-containing protein [Chloroflexota bacterium]|nr:FAD binding domain-containing protein [Chloroflexota bacterium]
MLRLPRFTYLAPRELGEATTLLAEHAPRATLVAGGTDLFPNMKRRQQEPAVVIGLRGVGALRAIEPSEDGGLRVGATASLHEVATHPLLRDRYPALATAAGLVSTPHLRRMGTIGGNLCLDTRCTYYDQTYQWRKSIDFCKKKDGDVCWVAPGSPRCWAVSSSDTAPVAIALGARLRLASASGERVVDAGSFFQDDGIMYLTRRPDEILSWLELPPLDGWRITYLKLRRRGSFDFPILGVAAAVRLADDGKAEAARLVLGAVGSSPVDQSELAKPLIGTRPSVEAIEEVATSAYKGARPLDNTDLNYAWRKKMARVYVKRALADVCGVSC